jgi:hypothetical protein
MESIEANLSKKLINIFQTIHWATIVITAKKTLRNKRKTFANGSRLTIITYPKISIAQIINDVVAF